MTEAEWLKCYDPFKMLPLLQHKGSARKRRLYACACLRCFWHYLKDERSRRAVEAAELYADGLIDENKLAEAGADARAAVTVARAALGEAVRARNDASPDARSNAVQTVNEAMLTNQAAQVVLRTCAVGGYDPSEEVDLRDEDPYMEAGRNSVCVIVDSLIEVPGGVFVGLGDPLRDIFVYPSRPAPAADPSWLAWNGGTVAKLTAAIYEERRFADLPILADVLEEAGCADAAILAHCRGNGEHVRGCWVVDLLLGKA